jgi:hypothetical protein
MREDNREKFVEELLDAALPNHRGAEPQDGLEDRVLTNLRQQSRAAHPVSRNPAPVIIAAVIVLALFAVDHLRRSPVASDTAISAVSRVDEPRSGFDSTPAALQTKAEGIVGDGMKLAKAFTTAQSPSRRRDFALNLNSRSADERSESGLRIEEAQISEIRLDDIVIGGNERQE